jgi:hypothetical protein
MIRALCCLFIPAFLCGASVDRHVIGCWDSLVDGILEESLVHKTVEMPLNHLGLSVIYCDIQKPLPVLAEGDGICGVILCFKAKAAMKDPKVFVEWAIDAVDKGKKVVVMRNPGFLADLAGKYTPGDVQNRLFERIGFTNSQEWIDYPFEYQVSVREGGLTPFERDYPHPLAGFYRSKVSSASARSYLSVEIPGKQETRSDLIIIGPQGAYISEFYANSYDEVLLKENPRGIGWYVDPFRFFEMVFALPVRPIPDVTTLAGRRIYFANCSGDSWNGETLIEEYVKKGVYCSEVILEKVIKPHPDLPVSVGVVAADVDPLWVAKERSRDVARQYFALPQVETASHTYSHPFYWEYFRTGGPEKEIDYLYRYPYGTWQNSYLSWFRAKYYQYFRPKEFKKRKLKWGYVTPRAYANYPFDLQQEISGAIDFLNPLAPRGKQIQLLVWSGDARPWDTPVLLSQRAGVKNFGGGFVRFDPDYPSNLFVYPLARAPGGVIQPYAPANAENNYTAGWKDQFYGFQYLPATWIRTGSPRRLKPVHLSYHSYSGEFQASVDAVLKNIAFAKEQMLIPIRTKRYCEIVEGFFSTVIEPLGEGQWKIRNRQGLQTVRFDQEVRVDCGASLGVIGYQVSQGCSYVYLDAACIEPVVVLKKEGTEDLPYLIESSWEVWDLKRESAGFGFKVQGWGTLIMQWRMAQKGKVSVGESFFEVGDEGILNIQLDLPFNQPIEIKVIML